MREKLKLLIGMAFILLSGCQMSPKCVPAEETYQQAQEEIQEMFAKQCPLEGTLDFNQAMARGLQYNLDHRVKQASAALKAGQMHMAEMALVPELSVSGSIYNRNNDNSTYGSDENGNPTNVIAFGSDKTINSYRRAIKWNVIDLGLGYIKAKEEGDRLLIAEEESRQQLQRLVQDIRVAYWNAYNAQEMRCELKEFQTSLENTKALLNAALKDNEIPKQDILEYQNMLYENSRRLVQAEDKLNKSAEELRYLLNLPLDTAVQLKKPPLSITRIQNLRGLNFEKLDAITLVCRPELQSQSYQKHIAKLGLKAVVFQALPNITFNGGRNFNSNTFLVNKFWNDRSVEVYWNIVNIAALPVSINAAKTQIKYEQLKQMAITMGALNETRIAYSHYQNLARESLIARNQTRNAAKKYKLFHDRKHAALASKQQVILSKLQALLAKMDEIIVLSNLSVALGDLYIAVGFDILPREAMYATPDQVLQIIEKNLAIQENMDFKSYVSVTYDKLFSTENY